MRSYIMSLTLVACVLGGYTAIVLNSDKHSNPLPEASDVQKPSAQIETDSREPASHTTSVN